MNPGDYHIIDSHIHPAVDSESDANWFTSSGTLQDQVDDLKRAGISQACGAPIKKVNADSFDQIRYLNDKALEFRDKFPDFYFPAIQTSPLFPEESCREIERCCGGEGVRWIGELVGYFMSYANEYTSENALTIMSKASEYNAVVNFHCGDLEIISNLCEAVPDLKLVLAHPTGAKESIPDRVAVVAKYPNLHLDISGSGIDRYGMVRKAIDMAGIDKIIFGSDYPVNNPAVYVGGMLYERLTEEERKAIFSENFLRLIGN